MKAVKIFSLLFFAATIVSAQDLRSSEVPQAITSAFKKDNAKATDVEWKRDMDNYKVEFDIGRMEHEIWYNASGEVIKREQDISKADLPKAVRNAIDSEYPGFRIDDVEMNWKNNETTYRVELEKGNEEWKVVFDEDGKILNKRQD